MNNGPKVAIVMGSDSDYPILESCIQLLKGFGVETTIMVCSAHRTPEKACQFAKEAEQRGFDAIIAAAGKAAHLPGVLAAYSVLPVIGLPIKSSTLDGLDALLSIVQMPPGVPVATVAINGSENAALLAIQILGGKYPEFRDKMAAYKEKMKQSIEDKDKRLQDKLNGLKYV
ncbi:MAG: 5-(carboxyamino)imidazole ribonucleotide mutase [Clostridiaceae bacterium]|nr:5-(carboxyamino)imidazole ribonucleotide mutase [Clostridiaceae bacterium]